MNRCDYLDPGLAWTGVKDTGRGATLSRVGYESLDKAEELSPEGSMTIQLRGNWNYPTTVRFGAGRISELGEAVKAAGMSNPLVVTDPVVAKMPMTAKAMMMLSAAGVRVTMFSEVQPNPVEANVAAGRRGLQGGRT